MKRRALLKSTAAIAATSTIAAPAIAQGKREFKMVTSWPKNFPGLGTAPERFAKQLSDATDGQYTIKIYAGGELVHPLKCHDAVQEGTADMYHSADYYYVGKLKGYAFFTVVPFGMTATEHNAWLYHGGGQELWDEAGAQFGIKHLAAGNSGPQMGGWFKDPIKSLEDFKGLKMRIPGLGGEVLKKLGGTPVTLAGSEILPALQSGTIDAAEWVGPWNDLAFGFYKLVKNYQFPGFHEPNAIFNIGINKEVWDDLPKNIQTIITNIAMGVNDYNLAEFNANNTKALNTLINDHGVVLNEYSDEISKAIGKASQEVLLETREADPLTQKIADSYLDFRKQAVEWSGLSVQSYMNKRSQFPFE